MCDHGAVRGNGVPRDKPHRRPGGFRLSQGEMSGVWGGERRERRGEGGHRRCPPLSPVLTSSPLTPRARPPPTQGGRATPHGVFKPPRRDALGTWKGGRERAFERGGAGRDRGTTPPSPPDASTPNGTPHLNRVRRQQSSRPAALPARDGGRAPPPRNPAALGTTPLPPPNTTLLPSGPQNHRRAPRPKRGPTGKPPHRHATRHDHA